MFMSHQQNAIQDDNITIANKSFENLSKFTYLEIKLTFSYSRLYRRESWDCRLYHFGFVTLTINFSIELPNTELH
jgi:hypothetical protein